MRRKQIQYEEAIKLRKKGKSIKQIARLLSVSVGIVSLWCREVELTLEQKERLKRRKVRVRHLRQLAKKSHTDKLIRVKKLFNEARDRIPTLTGKELFLAGLALYWAEGFKSPKEARLGFCNSDPRMIKFMMKWFKKALKVNPKDFILRAEFNETHKNREGLIKSFWSQTANIPLSQFEKSFHHHSTWLRTYPNPDKYFGVLRIRVRKSSELLIKTKGWIDGLSTS